MHINHYEIVKDQFLEKRKTHPEESGRKVPIDRNQLAVGGVKVVDAPIMIFDIADSNKISKQLGGEHYTEWLGLALHCLFHCVDDHKGTIDKYTGDGAMVSFSLGSKEERCINAKECAVKISQILNEILNPYYRKLNYNEIYLRIGIDFGPIRIEKVGKKSKSQLIVIGSPANTAKILEDYGKKLEFDQYTTICLGYDMLYNLPEKYYIYNNKNLCRYCGNINNLYSYMDKSRPYKIYEYEGRTRP